MTKKRRRLYLGWGIYFVIVIGFITSAITQPIWDHIHPKVLGLPLSIFMVAFFQVLICLGMVLVFFMDGKLYNKEADRRKAGEEIEY